MITIVDYGLGNLGSIRNMFKRIQVPVTVSNDLEVIDRAEKLLLPGVGAFDNAMERLTGTELRRVLDRKVLEERVPILGICLGMQLLTEGSEEGRLPGLGWVPGRTTRFPAAPGLKVPHMGWNRVVPTRTSRLTDGLPDESRFYFVHTYFVTASDPADAVLKATHGVSFDAALEHENIFGAQFHPEKSHKFGMHLLSNFAKI